MRYGSSSVPVPPAKLSPRRPSSIHQPSVLLGPVAAMVLRGDEICEVCCNGKTTAAKIAKHTKNASTPLSTCFFVVDFEEHFVCWRHEKFCLFETLSRPS